MNNSNILYPNWEIRTGYSRTEVFTYLRKKHTDSKWYKILISVSTGHRHEGISEQEINNLVIKLIGQVYIFSICGIVCPELTTLDGQSCHILDEKQYDEQDRLEALINYLPVEEVLKRKRKEPEYPFNYYNNYE